jgi:anti-anti-sigma regulatory factor
MPTPARWGRREITVVGRLDVTNSRSFLRLVRVLVHDGARRVVVHLGDAEVDAAGIAALAMAQCRLQRLGGEIVLGAPRSSTLKLLDEARLIDRFLVW